MAKTDKDVLIKEGALRFCVLSAAIPYLEVPVTSAVDLTSDEKVLTDIDVLGLQLSAPGEIRRILFDCKSSSTPPIARVFWLSGLMNYVSGDEGFVILGRKAEKAHRLTSQTLRIRLFDRAGFQTYAAASDPDFPLLNSYAASISAWHNLRSQVEKASAKHRALWKHLSSDPSLGGDVQKRFRRVLMAVREAKGELDPTKPLHMALFTEAVLAAAVCLTVMVGELRNAVDLRDDKEAFSVALKYYLWGGRDGYATLQKMSELSGRNEEEFENSLVAWPNLVQLVRFSLEAPTTMHSCCMPIREIGLRYLVERREEADLRIGRLIKRKRARQFSHRIADYVAVAGKLPKDFAVQFSREVDTLFDLAEGEGTRE